MPFDPSGNFTRVHNWQEDRDNGIRILADRHDAEDDNFAAAFNQVFLRGGIVPMTGDLNMGGYNINTIKAGSAAAPSLTWELDGDTGFYQVNPATIGFSVNGVNRVDFKDAGLFVNGGGMGIANSAGTALGFWNSDYSVKFGYVSHDGANLILNNSVAGDIRMSAGGATRMIVLPNGRVGIGTTEPIAATFHVKELPGSSGVVFQGANNVQRFYSDPTGFVTWTLSADMTASAPAVNLASRHVWALHGVGEKMRLTENGWLGVGETSPTARIHARNTGPATDWIGGNALKLSEETGNAAYYMQLGMFIDPVSGAWGSGVQSVAANVVAPLRLNPGGGLVVFGSGVGGQSIWARASLVCAEPSAYKIRFYDGGLSDEFGYIYHDSSSMEIANGQTNGFLQFKTEGTGAIHFVNNGSIRCLVSSDGLSFRPATPAGMNIGTSAEPWSVIFANTPTIQPSDQREKTPLAPLTDAELAAASAISKGIGSFRWLDTDKYDDKAHIGVIAQEVIAACEAQGLDALSYGFVRYDEWEAAEEMPGTPPQEAVVADEENGVLARPSTQGIAAIPARPAGNRYSVAYSELAMFIAAAQEQRLAALEALL